MNTQTSTINAATAPLAYCAGEPAGVGVDLITDLSCHALRDQVVVIGCAKTLRARAGMLGREITCVDYDGRRGAGGLPVGHIRLVDRPCPSVPEPGRPDTANVPWLLGNLDTAFKGIGDGQYAGLVTGPVDKSVVRRAGVDFSGHTEYLAALDGDRGSVMLLAADNIRVALVTTHVRLADVAQALISKIDSGEFARIVHTLVNGLRDLYGISRPRVAVCGLNPHAGEGGQLGTEEVDWLGPAVEALRAEFGTSAELVGPVAADTAFTPPHLEHVDAHLGMYHDQVLTAIKSVAFGKIVNTTLGLSIVRTSVDHGVAYDRAGTGRANPGSLYLAIEEARRLARARAGNTA
ncbi:MAG: 4-hydroxythreonine-4-phosphate dehydrogenase PdxA [Proteobacteria bacterium]|nr:4-hydroxythreonine-4-phosphate dehydrogenase PdxA [Pseudomonadota bacterium]